MRRQQQNGEGVLRVVTCGLSDRPKMTLVVDGKHILCYRRWQDGKWEPIYTQDRLLQERSLEIAEVINRL